MTNNLFYDQMNSFQSFNDITKASHFEKVPSDWKIFITDIKGSTKAIEEGRYKDINTIGAAAIVCVQKAMKGIEVPFVFGGDGATVIIPPSHDKIVLEKLLELKKLSKEQFRVDLRIGIVEVGEIQSDSIFLEVAKFELAAKKCIAIFKGGGLNAAESLVKSQEDKYCVEYKEDVKDCDLTGLSCRWKPLPNKNGSIASILVESRKGSEVYDGVLEKINKVFLGSLEKANPVNLESAKYKTLKETLNDEKKIHANFAKSVVSKLINIFLSIIIFKYDFYKASGMLKSYRNSMRSHSDYRKFDDLLRMVIDCSSDQVLEIEKYLKTEFEKGNLYYGLFESDHSLMTCYVDDLSDGNHIHFIDGGNGGYAMAAKKMKSQIKESFVIK